MFTNRPAQNNRSVSQSSATATSVADFGDGKGNPSADVYHIRDRVQRKLLSDTEGEVNLTHLPQMRQMIEAIFNQVLGEEDLLYTRSTRAQMLEWVIADILGYGPLEPLLRDPTITEVMVNGSKLVYIERYGKIEKTKVVFENDGHLMRIIDRIVSP
ncbi:MAG: CpaF family protein, partial [Anaerolineales bacterium]